MDVPRLRFRLDTLVTSRDTSPDECHGATCWKPRGRETKTRVENQEDTPQEVEAVRNNNLRSNVLIEVSPQQDDLDIGSCGGGQCIIEFTVLCTKFRSSMPSSYSNKCILSAQLLSVKNYSTHRSFTVINCRHFPIC